MKNFILITLFAIVLIGCATADKMNKVKIGMTKSEVIEVIGPPASISAKGESEFLNYSLSETDDDAFIGFTSPYYVHLINERVDSYGRLSDFDNTQKQSTIKEFSVNIISEPSGAKIEINNNYIGKTPITVKLEGWEATRTFTRSHTLVAHPMREGGQTQIKVFSGWSKPSVTYGDKIPMKIYFNMSLVRMPQKHDININK